MDAAREQSGDAADVEQSSSKQSERLPRQESHSLCIALSVIALLTANRGIMGAKLTVVRRVHPDVRIKTPFQRSREIVVLLYC
jgi:hypothetical protein